MCFFNNRIDPQLDNFVLTEKKQQIDSISVQVSNRTEYVNYSNRLFIDQYVYLNGGVYHAVAQYM